MMDLQSKLRLRQIRVRPNTVGRKDQLAISWVESR